MTVFDVFQEIPYKFLVIERGTVQGDIIVEKKSFNGVFKYRESEEALNNMELFQSSATLHAHPDDSFGVSEYVGQGVEVNGLTYTITNATQGMNFDNGQIEHLTFTLQRADFIDGTANNND